MKLMTAKYPFTALFVLCTALASQSALAENFEMSVVLDRAHGALVEQGDYETAIDRISHDRRQPFASSTNLCVAQTMTDRFEQAASSCDTAVSLAEFAVENGHRKDRDYVTELAVALCNRGVLRAKTGDPSGAAGDFSKAAKLNSQSNAPVQNLSHLKNGISADLAKN